MTKLEIQVVDYVAKEQVSKKTGNPYTIHSLTCLTSEGHLLEFGYDNVDQDTDTDSLKSCQRGNTGILVCEVVGNRYRRNAPVVRIRSFTQS